MPLAPSTSIVELIFSSQWKTYPVLLPYQSEMCKAIHKVLATGLHVSQGFLSFFSLIHSFFHKAAQTARNTS